MMKLFIDIKLQYDEVKGYHDIVINSNGDIEVDDSYDTSILLALGTDGRASNEEMKKVELQRGSLVDLFTKRQNGSKLWLLEQARTDTASRNRSVDYAMSALKYFMEDGFVKNVTVTGSLTAKGTQIFVVIQGFDGVFDKYRYNALQNSMYKEVN